MDSSLKTKAVISIAILHIAEQGASVRRKGDRICIYSKTVCNSNLPAAQIDALLLYGNIQITSQAISLLLDRGASIGFLSQSGKIKGILRGSDAPSIALRLAQHDAFHDVEYRRSIACVIVQTKIENQLVFLSTQPGTEAEQSSLREIIPKLQAAEDIPQALGYEGGASQLYFAAYGRLMPTAFPFERRSRRPAENAVNAMLNLGYMALLWEIIAQLDALGFETSLGFLHAIRYGRNGLGLDVMRRSGPSPSMPSSIEP